MSKPFKNVSNLFVNGNTITILGIIGDDWWGESNRSNEFLREFKNLEKKYNHIIIEINSPGGYLFDGQPIYNAIANSKAKTTTRVIGMAASMASIIALAGDEVECYDNAMIMLHSTMNCVCGNAKDMREEAELLDKFTNSLIPAVAKKIGKTEDEVRTAYFDYEDHWFTAKEARDEGLMDIIIDEAADLPEGVEDMSMDRIMAIYADKYGQKNGQPIKNFFKNLINPTDMKLPKAILDACGLEANATVEDVTAYIENITSERDTANQQVTDITAERDTATQQVTDITAERDTAIQERDTATQQVTDITAERDAAQANVNSLTSTLDEVDETIASAESVEDKITAFGNYVGDEPTQALRKQDPNNGGQPTRAWDEAADSFL